MKTLSLVDEAVEADNDALLELASSCSMEGQVGLCIDRSPDFLALDRLEGEEVRVGVVRNLEDRPVGCVAVAKKPAYVNGRATTISYIGDLKIAPGYRNNSGVILRLIHWVNERCTENETPLSFLTILDGNELMQSHATPDSRMGVRQIGTVCSYSIGLLWRRRLPTADVSVTRATAGDVEEMVHLWNRIAPSRQFSTVFTPQSFDTWVNQAPGLDIGNYLLARNGQGVLLGFVGVWDQSSFKQTRITSYSPSLKMFKAGFNAIAPRFGTPPLPPVGGALPLLSSVHLCVDSKDVKVLRALLLTIYDDYRKSQYSFFTVGLDKKDGLVAATKGLMAQPTDIAACTFTHRRAQLVALDGRPVHHEIALV